MNLKTSKSAETKSSSEFSYSVRAEGAFSVVEVRKVGETAVLGGVKVSREEKPELAAALEAGVSALAGYVARALAQESASAW